jgi:hypothetical protein
MFRITRIVPTIVLTATALALAAPAAQAKPSIAPSGGTAYVSPSVQSTRVFRVYGSHLVHRDARSVVVTTGDTPLANPVQLPVTPINSSRSGNGFDTAAAAIGAVLAGIAVMLAVGVGFRRRGQLAT